jgi:hypothetical protein
MSEVISLGTQLIMAGLIVKSKYGDTSIAQQLRHWYSFAISQWQVIPSP